MNTLAAISGEALVYGFIHILIVAIICWVLLWVVRQAPFGEPFKSILTWVVYLAGAVFLINFLLGMLGKPFIVF